MTDQPTLSKTQLLEALKSSGDEILAKLEEVPAEAMEAGCYENGWNARQVLAHMAAIEWSYPRLIDVASNGPPPEKKAEPRAQAASKPARGGINDYNNRQIERYADASVAELIDVFRKNRATTIATVEATEESLFATPVKSAGGIQGTLGNVLNMVAVMHVRSHFADIVASASK
ncbi:MAG: DinB family protein [Dehalococcoidia bacterium]